MKVFDNTPFKASYKLIYYINKLSKLSVCVY